jgi:hypothetical protein
VHRHQARRVGGGHNAAVEKDEAYSRQAFVTALKAFKAKVAK